MSKELVMAQNSWEKIISGEEFGENKPVLLIVQAKLYTLGDNRFPYFSITGNVIKRDKRFRDPYISGGCIHETILKYFPDLAPLVLVHLSGPDGVPMHAESNARYWAGFSTYTDGSPMGEYKPSMLAKHLQADKATAQAVRDGFSKGIAWDRITKDLGLIELWSSQAGKARSLMVTNERVSA